MSNGWNSTCRLSTVFFSAAQAVSHRGPSSENDCVEAAQELGSLLDGFRVALARRRIDVRIPVTRKTKNWLDQVLQVRTRKPQKRR